MSRDSSVTVSVVRCSICHIITLVLIVSHQPALQSDTEHTPATVPGITSLVAAEPVPSRPIRRAQTAVHSAICSGPVAVPLLEVGHGRLHASSFTFLVASQPLGASRMNHRHSTYTCSSRISWASRTRLLPRFRCRCGIRHCPCGRSADSRAQTGPPSAPPPRLVSWLAKSLVVQCGTLEPT